ncbi:hypothetical protein L1987_63124 [Smallanthus sonchifolius]|uniref:Uncharacterized protein n=1 Tax=Smallanthus sonchifolius TaxID=185202 RepID=A0ACB9CCF0_9ASTR|nr:hypothetical protein L1987_63124 [Smallanthus sonchifolius]
MAKKLYVLDAPAPEAPDGNTAAARKAWEKQRDDATEVACLMLACMSRELQKSMEDLDAFDMIEQLKGMFLKQARQERYETMSQLIRCTMQEGTPVSTHVLKMKGYIDQMNKLGFPMKDEMATDFILNSLPSSYAQFVMNFNMNGLEKTVAELHGMLKTSKMNIQGKKNQVLMVRSAGVKKPNPKKRGFNSKGKKKVNVAAKPATNNNKKVSKAPPPEERQCFECNKMGHCKRNYPEYLAKLKLQRASGEGTSSGILIYVIEIFTVSSNTWVFDTGCGYHIIKVLQEPKSWRKLKQDDMELIVGDGKKVPVLATGTYHLSCPSGLVVVLNNCLFAPGLTRNIISVSLLFEQGFKTMSRNHERYFVSFIDDYSRYAYVYLMKHKHETFEKFKEFQNEVEKQLDKSIKTLQSDRGGEYLSLEFLNHLKEHGIISLPTPPRTPQLNGVSERRNRTLLNMARSMMCRTNLPHSFWSYALMTASRLVNLAPTKKVDKTPYEIWNGSKPNLSYLRVWGCDAYVTSDSDDKLDPKGEKVVFVGYYNKSGYYSYHPDANIVSIKRKGRFLESSRSRKEPNRYLWHLETSEVLLVAESNDEPTNYKSAISDPEFEKWLEAMNAETQSMRDNQVWDLIELPLGFTQTQGIDYDETFSPVAMIKSIRILLAITAYHDYEIWQMDVKTAFLNGHLSEDVYMVQPDGFVGPKYPSRVCKLNKSIYGLKQASRSWNLHFDQKIKKIGFVKNEDEPCVYRKARGSTTSFLILYVDDILIIGNNILCLTKDRCKRLLRLSQSTYIDKMMTRFRMENSKKGGVPMTKGTVLNKSQSPSTDIEIKEMEAIPYASAIGSIMYAMLCTRPDVSYALRMTSRFQQSPSIAHWTAVKNILRYLRRTKDMFLIFGGVKEELTVRCYTDASFQTDRDDSRSQSGFVFTINGGAVSWKSSKQSVVADSTTESEYIAASDAAKEASWMKKFITDLDVVSNLITKPSTFKGSSTIYGKLWNVETS